LEKTGLSRTDLLVERDVHGRSHVDLYDTAHQLCLRHRLDGGTPHPGLFWVLKRDQDRLPILQLERKIQESGEGEKTSLPHLKLCTALLLVAARDFESARKHYYLLSGDGVAPEINQQALVGARNLALLEGEFNRAHEAEKSICARFPDSAMAPPTQYLPEAVLGAGLTGSTWLARETKTGKQRVLKFAQAGQGDHAAFLHLCNTMLAQQMDHPSLEKVLRVEPGPDGRMVRVSRYRPGSTLEQVVSGQGPLHDLEWLGIAWSLTEGLLGTHARGLVHKALRPGHVLLIPWGASGTVNRWRVLLHGADQIPSRSLLHALLTQPELEGKTELGRSAARFAAALPPETLGKPRGPQWFGPIQDVYGMGVLTAFGLTGTLKPSPLEWKAHGLDETWRELVEKAASWSQAPRLKHLLEFREWLEKIAGPEILEQLRAREKEHAILATAEAVAEDPMDLAALGEHAEALGNANRFQEAESFWNRCLDQAPQQTAALTGRSFCRMHMGKQAEAEADLRLAAETQPDQAEPTALLARLLGGDLRPKEVLELTRDAVVKHPQDLTLRAERAKAFMALGHHRDGLAELQQAVRIQPENPHLWAMLAQTQGHLEDLTGSLESWGKALILGSFLTNGEQARFLLERAMVFEKQDRVNDALKDTLKAAQLESSPLVRMTRVRVLARAGKFQEGETEQRKLLAEMASQVKPIPALAILLLADLLQDLGRSAESKHLVDQVLAASELKEEGLRSVSFTAPTQPPLETAGTASQDISGITAQLEVSDQDIPHARLRRAVERVRDWDATQNRSPDRRELKLVLDDLRAAQENKLPDPVPVALQANLALGQLHGLLQKPKDAAMAFSQAAQLDRFSIRALVGRAQARLDMGLGILALEDCNKALELSPGNKTARLMWCRVQHRLKHHAEIITALEEWLIQAPQDRDYMPLLAEALENRGYLEGALRQWEGLLRLAPKNHFGLEGKIRILARLNKANLARDFLEGPGKALEKRSREFLDAMVLLAEGSIDQMAKAKSLLDDLAKTGQPEGWEQIITRLRIGLAQGKKRESKALLVQLAGIADQGWEVLLGEWLEALAFSSPARSLARLEKLVVQKPDFLPWQGARVLHWMSLEKWKQALAESARLAQQAAEESWALETRAVVLACAPSDLGGNPEQAVMLARQALDWAGENSTRIEIALAFCLARKGSKTAANEAIQILRKLLEKEAHLPPVLTAFGRDLLSHLNSRKPFSWKGPEWHRLSLI